MSTATPGAQPGWYPDASVADAERYWDGQRWAEDLRFTNSEPPPSAPPPGVTSPVAYSSQPAVKLRGTRPGFDPAYGLKVSMIVVGWVAAIFYPAVGVAIGGGLLFMGERQQGGLICGLSLVMLLFGWLTAMSLSLSA